MNVPTLLRTSMFLLLAACLCSCANTETTPVKIEKPISLQPADWNITPFNKLSFEQAVKLSPEQEQHFLTFYNSTYNEGIAPHQRLYTYLSRFVDNFSYQNTTLSSNQALTEKTGNCMSLALVTTSLAKLAGLEISYQVINTAPVYYKKGENVVVSQHIRTKVYAKDEPIDEDTIYFGRTHIIIDYYKNQVDLPGRKIAHDEFASKYYANLAADAYANKDFELANEYSSNAMFLFPSSAENINTHALVLRRLQGLDNAINLLDKSYQKGITSLNLMSNYKSFLLAKGDKEKATLISNDIKNITDDNPYQWLELGDELYKKGKYNEALSYFEKAEALAPYLDEVFLAQAKAIFKQGNNPQLVKQKLNAALNAPIKVNEVNLYQAKLAAFESH